MFEKWYRIPEYQRPYVWGKDQVSELLNDLNDSMITNEKSQYFLGSMVLQKKNKSHDSLDYSEYDVLDGQQRLTTLFLLIAVIRDLTEDNDCLETCESIIFQKKNSFKGVPERLRIVFDIRQEVKTFINSYVKEQKSTLSVNQELLNSYGKDIDSSILNMSRNIIQIREYFQENLNHDAFAKYLLNQVLMIYVGSSELDDAFRLFTVMNNRGIKLRSSDILKANNLAAIDSEEERVLAAKNWEEAENYFGEDFDEFLSHLRSILVMKKATMGLLKEFEEHIYSPSEYDRSTKISKKLVPLLNKGIDTFNFVGKYQKYYSALFDNDHDKNGDYELHNILELMKIGFESNIWVAPLLKYYARFKTTDLIPFTKALNNAFAYDWIIGLTPTKRIENINHWMNNIDVFPSERIVSELKEHINHPELESYLDNKIYGKRPAKYLMLKLDLALLSKSTKFNLPPTISIEHILPQTPKSDSKWMVDFSESDREYAQDRLGNLTLLSRRKNSSQNNRDYLDKKERYFKNNIELFSNSIRIYQKFSEWKMKDFKKNHEDVRNILIKSFHC